MSGYKTFDGLCYNCVEAFVKCLILVIKPNMGLDHPICIGGSETT